MTIPLLRLFTTLVIVFLFITPVTAQEFAHGTLERIKVKGESLTGNLEGNSPERDVFVYLPPGYAANPTRHYPVIYVLHGYSIGVNTFISSLNVPDSIDKAIGSGTARGMILVFPDAQTLHDGSMYSNSVTTGDWEGYLARDLVKYIDTHYRTIPLRESRGLSGHSMGGYGTIRIGMKHPETFSSIYAMSSCCLSANMPGPEAAELEKVKTIEEAAGLPFGPRASLASAAAWSPNPDNPPFYFDLPTKNGQVQLQVVAEWAANAPLAMLPQYVPNLKSLDAIALDVGLQDFLLKTNQELDTMMNRFGIKHSFETYEGDHVNHVADRFEQHVLPFFSQHLAFGETK